MPNQLFDICMVTDRSDIQDSSMQCSTGYVLLAVFLTVVRQLPVRVGLF